MSSVLCFIYVTLAILGTLVCLIVANVSAASAPCGHAAYVALVIVFFHLFMANKSQIPLR